MGIHKKSGRLPQECELFSKRYYRTDIAPVVAAVTSDLVRELGRKLTRKERLNAIKSCTRDVYAGASKEVQLEIKQELAKAKQRADAGRTGRALDVDARIRTPQQYQEYVLHALCLL